MQDRPHAQELAQALAGFLETEILPTISDSRLRFRTLVAMNALGMLERELVAGDQPLRSEYNRLADLLGERPAVAADRDELRQAADTLRRTLAQRIRTGDIPRGTLATLRDSAEDKLRITNPSFLARYS